MIFASGEYVAGAGAGNIGTGVWAVSFWINGINAISRFLGKYTSNNGWNVYVVNGNINFISHTAGAAGTNLTSSSSGYTAGTWHHALIYGDASNNWGWFRDGVADGSGSGATFQTLNPAGNLYINSSAFSVYNGANSLHDVRLYNNITMTPADLAKILYEARGGDNITEGMVTRCALEFGPGGTVVGTTPNLGSAGGTLSVSSGTPDYESIPLN